ncbi:MAG: GNAT family N-acetyltransferase [Candidatus Wallbacteria bacterium]
MKKIELFTKRLWLRPWQEKDAEPFCEMNSDPEVMKYFPNPLNNDETINFIERIKIKFAETGFGLFAVEVMQSGEFIGFIGLSQPKFKSFFTPCYEIGWRLKKNAWGQGYATEGAAECLKLGFGQLNLDKIYSFTAAINLRSENVMKRLGLIKEGEFPHPSLPPESPLSRHLLYAVTACEFNKCHKRNN